jgi:hypothetical protein
MSNSKPTKIWIRGDGVEGSDGGSGENGIDGVEELICHLEDQKQENEHRQHGTNGGDATKAKPGGKGQDIVITLSTVSQHAKEEDNNSSDSSLKSVSNMDGYRVQVHAISSESKVLWDESYPLPTVPIIGWSSRGGNGGKGGRGGNGGCGAVGPCGIDAQPPHFPGTNGGPGGNGGKGGAGSHGANGGKGGTVTVSVSENDAYLLMLLDPPQFDSSALSGGKGGKPGQHGLGGTGGPGGQGGKGISVSLDDGKKKKVVTIPGGKNGISGVAGLTPVWDLLPGHDGKPGTFSIEVTDGNRQQPQYYDSRYQLVFESLDFTGKYPMLNSNDCEFGDVITIQKIVVKNIGQMPLPKYQEIHFAIKESKNSNVVPLIARNDAFLPTDKVCDPGEYAVSEGELRFFAGFPDEVDDEYDFDPLRRSTIFHIQAFQYGPLRMSKEKMRVSDFKQEYPGFHEGDGSTVTLAFSLNETKPMRSREEGIPIMLRYPIENNDGLKALQSLSPGECSVISLALQNVGSIPLGGFDVNAMDDRPRRVALRYFYLRSRMYDLPNDYVRCKTLDPNDDGVEIDLIDNPILLEVPSIAPGESHEFEATLELTNDSKPYTRMALIVDIFIESLPVPKGIKIVNERFETDPRMPAMSVVQRRKLEFICEPAYQQKEGASFVLVTSYATTLLQFEAWTQHVFTETLNLEHEVFSLSRYGSLNPAFTVENGLTLKDAFCNKIIVLLTEPFKEDPRDKKSISPIEFLPYGCMQQTSGFFPSTRWLIVGVNGNIPKRLVQKHLASEPKETGEFSDVSSYQKFIQKLADQRASRGREKDNLPIRSDTVHVSLSTSTDEKAAQKLIKAAGAIAEFLTEVDPLNQYTIEYFDKDFSSEKKGIGIKKNSCLRIRRGYCRSLNTAICINGNYCAEPRHIKSHGYIMAIAEAMTRESRVANLVDAIRSHKADHVVTALKYACVAEMIRECDLFLESDMKLNEDLELSFPTIGSLLESVEMSALLRDCKSSEELRIRACEVLSDLLARLELVANSKDLRPRFQLLGGSQKKTTLEAMSEVVSRLRLQWKNIISTSLMDDIKKEVKLEVKDFLKEESGKKSINYRSDKRWIQGLAFLHSTENEKAFGITYVSKRLIEYDLMDTQVDSHKKIPAPSVRVYSYNEMDVLQQELGWAKDRSIEIANSIRLRRQFWLSEANKQRTEL